MEFKKGAKVRRVRRRPHDSSIDEHCKEESVGYECIMVNKYSTTFTDDNNYGHDLDDFEPVKSTEEPTMKEYESVNHPSHYNQGGKEVIDMMIDIWGKISVSEFCLMNSFKYRMRMGLKPDQPIERDLEKAKWYESKAKQLKDER